MFTTESSRSIWERDAVFPRLDPLSGDRTADLCVIGAGISGMTTALLAAREGRKVVVVDRAGPSSGETGQTSAHLSFVMDEGFAQLRRTHGDTDAARVWRSHAAAVDLIKRLIDEEEIDCDFARVHGYLIPATGDDETIEKEWDASREVGIPAELVTDFSRGHLGPCRAIRYSDQAQFHPLRYLAGLTSAAIRAGVEVYAETEVIRPPEGGSEVAIACASGTIHAGASVIATNYPITEWLTVLPRLAAYRSYVIAAPIPSAVMEPLLLWDTADPYHYVRLAEGRGPAEKILLVGGADHRTGQAKEAGIAFDVLAGWMRDHFPEAGDIAYRWSGQILEPIDGLGFMGPHPGQENLYVITGDSGQGLTHGTLGGMLIADQLQGRKSEWGDLYDPSRLALGSPADAVRENLSTARQYVDVVFREDVDSEDDIPPGSGAVVRNGLRPVAVHREKDGTINRCSAICTHLGCVVRWNGVENSWDCPCHGSRFGPKGNVLTGPALEPLRKEI